MINHFKQQQVLLDGHKLNWHPGRVSEWLNGNRIAPITIDCALTRKCTYNCVYCYGKLQENDEKKMTLEVIKNFLYDAKGIGVRAVSFVSDGESTCSPHLNEAIVYGERQGLNMALGTNGYLLKLDAKTMDCLTYLRFNISAADRDEYSNIHGCSKKCYDVVIRNIKNAVAMKKAYRMETTIGIQMVLLPQFADQILPLAELGKQLGVDYFVIKHCSDDENNSLGVEYSKYAALSSILEEAEAMSTKYYTVKAKWSKIMSGGKRCYSRCYGPQFMLQMSGSGLVAPCGMLFNDKYKKYHIGNIAETRFYDLFYSKRYWEVMDELASEKFNAKTMCGSLCLQHKVNEYLNELKTTPQHVNFV